MSSIPQTDTEVKTEHEECGYDDCHEPVFQEKLCWEHFCREKIAEWDAQSAERKACLEGVGYIFGDPVDRAWFGYAKEDLR